MYSSLAVQVVGPVFRMILRLSMRCERCAHAHSLQSHLFIAIIYRPAFRPQGLHILVQLGGDAGCVGLWSRGDVERHSERDLLVFSTVLL